MSLPSFFFFSSSRGSSILSGSFSSRILFYLSNSKKFEFCILYFIVFKEVSFSKRWRKGDIRATVSIIGRDNGHKYLFVSEKIKRYNFMTLRLHHSARRNNSRGDSKGTARLDAAIRTATMFIYIRLF